MNKRIRQLALEAGMYVDLKGEPWPKWMSSDECEIAYARFAELIIQECATVIERNLFQGIGWNTSRAVKQHFGIEDQEHFEVDDEK
jgi:hypothetical protein